MSFFTDVLTNVAVPLLVAVSVSYFHARFLWANSRKALNVADLDALSQSISEIRGSSTEYWANSKIECVKLIEARITGMLHGAQKFLYSMKFLRKDEASMLRADFERFRSLCTSETFDQRKRKADFQKVKEIEKEGQALVAKLMSIRRSY